MLPSVASVSDGTNGPISNLEIRPFQNETTTARQMVTYQRSDGRSTVEMGALGEVFACEVRAEKVIETFRVAEAAGLCVVLNYLWRTGWNSSVYWVA